MQPTSGEEELERLFQLSLDMLCIAGFDGYFKRLNPAWERTFGFTPEELCSRPYIDFIHPDDRQATLAEAGKLAQGVRVISFENRYRCKDGSWKWLLWMSTPSPDHQRVYAIARDITERKVAEEKLKQYARQLEEARQAQQEHADSLVQMVRELDAARARAEDATRAKSDFLAHMSHEIRTPMNAIIGMTELALQSRLTDPQREYLETARDSAWSLLSILNDILDFSRIEARKLQLERVEFNLRETVEDAVRLLAVRAHQKGLELACDLPPDLPERVVGDPGRLRQVLVNLLGNAIKFTESGEIVVRSSSEATAGNSVGMRFSVSDTGIGIPATKQATIFEPFEQADTSTTRRFGGTGLGLAICQELVSLMNGRIWVDSNPGDGTTFCFTAWFDRAATAPAPVPVSSGGRMAGLRALVVDDNATNRRLLCRMLENWGLQPSEAAGGPEALQQMSQAAATGMPFGLVILDRQMPGMDGDALAAELASAPHPDAPVIMLTSAGLHPDRAAASRFAACLTKPVKQSDLFDAIAGATGFSATSAGSKPAERPSRTPRRRGARVLLVEDTAVNRVLAQRLLEARGCVVALASDGRQAIEVLDRQNFDLVLMDVQMPVMDGYAATAEIRSRERETGRHLPIVAMTAHAMEGDRERCLQAGMDDYISKPIAGAALDQMVARFCAPARRMKTREATASADPAAAPAVGPAAGFPATQDDGAALLARFGGNHKLFAEVARAFEADRPRNAAALARAIARRDSAAVARAAHTLRGAVANFGPNAAADLARRLEQAALAGRFSEAVELHKPLEVELDRLAAHLASLAGPERQTTRRRRPTRRSS